MYSLFTGRYSEREEDMTMLNSVMISEIIDAAMKKYAAENDDKKGLARKDVVLITEEYGGDYEDANMAMAEAMRQLSQNCVTYLS